MATPNRRSAGTDSSLRDPRPATPYDVVAESGLLSLRRYGSGSTPSGRPPVLLVYPTIKRPFILDLLPRRSVVRSLLDQGFSVYLSDWLPPAIEDCNRGLDAYINEDLAQAVDVICEREEVASVSLVGICCGGVLAAIYAAICPQRVRALVTVAAPFEMDPPVTQAAAEQIVFTWRNVPAWMVRSVMNARMRDVHQTAYQLAGDLGEPELAEGLFETTPELVDALQPWLDSDMPLSGQLYLDVVHDALSNANLLEGRLRVGMSGVELGNIRCPVLVIAGARDTLVPARCTERFAEVVGGPGARPLLFATGHLGLMLSRKAHRQLWPDIAGWLRTPGEQAFGDVI